MQMIVCKFESTANQKTVEKAFDKHFGNSVLENSNNTFYVDSEKAPAFCKVLGFYNRNDVAELEKIAEIMTKPNYGKKIEKYDKKCVDLQKKLNQAKQLVKMDGNTGLSGVMIGAGTMNNEIIDSLDRKVNELESDKRVAKVINKLNKQRDANHILDKTRQYTTSTNGGGISSLVSIGVSTEKQGKNIHKIIESMKNPDRNQMEQSLASFKLILEDLFKTVNEFGIMLATDGKKTPNASSETKIAFKDLSIENLLSLRDREVLTITK